MPEKATCCTGISLSIIPSKHGLHRCQPIRIVTVVEIRTVSQGLQPTTDTAPLRLGWTRVSAPIGADYDARGE
jgi:hypothetical protein